MISIIIPTFNERGSIKILIGAITNILRSSKATYEVLVIDDNSPDGTADVVRSISRLDDRVRVVVRYHNHGLGVSIADGIKIARGDIIIGMDADLNHDPSIIPAMIRGLSQADIVVASRFVSGGGMADAWRYGASLCFNFLLRVILRFPIWDNTSGYYAITRKQLFSLGVEDIYYGYGDYHLRLVYKAMKAGLRIREYPVRYKKRMYGQSKSHLIPMIRSYWTTAKEVSKK